MMLEIRSKFADPSAVILAALVVLAIAGVWQYANNSLGVDYYTAWAAADSLSNDSEHYVYSRASQVRIGREYRRKAMASETSQRHLAVVDYQRVLFMTATPFMYWVINLFATGEYETDLQIWSTLSLIAFALSILLMCRFLSFSVAGSLALLLPCLVWLEPLHSDLRVGNVNCVQLGMVALALWFLNRQEDRKWAVVAGFFAAATVLFKPNLATLLIVMLGAWIVRKEFAALISGIIGMAASTAIIFVITTLFTGTARSWLDWWEIMTSTVQVEIPGEIGNVSSALATSFGFELSFSQQAGMAIALSIVVLVFLWWGRRVVMREPGAPMTTRRDSKVAVENVQLVSLACVIPLLVFDLVWEHYFVLALPMLITAIRPWHGDSNRNWGSLVLHRILPAITLLCLMATPTRPYFDMNTVDYYAMVNRFAIWTLFALGLWQLRFKRV